MSVASKNLYELLGNDDGDSDTPSGPVKTVDKTSTRTAKRTTEPEAPAKPSGPVPNRRGGGFSGSEAAFRDRNAGQDRNRGRSTDEPPRGGPRGGQGARVRGGRGSRFPRDRDDRHSKGLPSGGDKESAQTGATEGDQELKDEQVGEAIAETDKKEADGEAVKEEATEPAEPEEKQISYADYLAQQAEKKLALDSTLDVRQANEGSKLDKKWAAAKELVKEEDDNFMVGSGGKAKRERERKTKQFVEIDNRYVEPERPARGGARGGRGGGRGRGESSRGSGPRGGGSSFRGGMRGGRDPGAASLNTSDQTAFPSLGS